MRTARPEAIDPAWAGAGERALPRLVAPTDHEDRFLRRWTPSAPATAGEETDLVWPVIRDRVPVEPEAWTGRALVVAAGRFGVPDPLDWFTTLLDAEEPPVRMAAVLGVPDQAESAVFRRVVDAWRAPRR